MIFAELPLLMWVVTILKMLELFFGGHREKLNLAKKIIALKIFQIAIGSSMGSK
jgi:hypothetical protein